METKNRKLIRKLVGADAAQIVKALRGTGRHFFTWQEHARLVGVLRKKGLGVREIQRLLRWSLGKVSEDASIEALVDLEKWPGSRRGAIKFAKEVTKEVKEQKRWARRMGGTSG